ncbi:hypothetical protein L208DRAFT_1417069 [Tricholoma matsutake]|nr:hypothetical protein L208DRAFT_1417069 [Tricholoma matsutake 945]
MTTTIPPPPPTQQPQSPEPAPDNAREDENWGNDKNYPRADRNNGNNRSHRDNQQPVGWHKPGTTAGDGDNQDNDKDERRQQQ